MTILDAIRDRALFGPWFSAASWRAWLVFLSALFGLPIEGDDLATFTAHTGRQQPPTHAAREGWVIVGRRGGKSRIAALVAVYLACFRSYDDVLAPGEVGTVAVIAADRRQARTILRYINGFLDAVPACGSQVVDRSKETITLSNRIVIEVHTASFRTLRGYTVVAAICDEIAFWRSDEASANPDSEILSALRPGMASVPGALLLCISSPYARKGSLWTTWQRHFGQEADPVLVWQGDTASMNPGVDPQVIADAYATDAAAAAAEYGAEFRRDIESFVSREAVMACVVSGRGDLPSQTGCKYVAFVDPAGGSGSDSYTLAIAHRVAEGRVVIDAIREVRPPFSPDEVTAEFAALLSRTYRVTQVCGDRYAGEWPRERFRKHGITYQLSERTKSQIYVDTLPLITAGTIELPDHARMLAQLCALERRTGRGRDAVDHPPRQHDDVINAACGAALAVTIHKRGGGEAAEVLGAVGGSSQLIMAGGPFPERPRTYGQRVRPIEYERDPRRVAAERRAANAAKWRT